MVNDQNSHDTGDNPDFKEGKDSVVSDITIPDLDNDKASLRVDVADLAKLVKPNRPNVANLEKSVNDLLSIVMNLNSIVTNLQSVVQQQRDDLNNTKARLHESETNLRDHETRITSCEAFEDVGGILASIAEAREFSVACISDATVDGIEKIVQERHGDLNNTNDTNTNAGLKNESEVEARPSGDRPCDDNDNETRPMSHEPVDVADIIASVTKAREISMECISAATAEGLEKITQWTSEYKILFGTVSAGADNMDTKKTGRRDVKNRSAAKSNPDNVQAIRGDIMDTTKKGRGFYNEDYRKTLKARYSSAKRKSSIIFAPDNENQAAMAEIPDMNTSSHIFKIENIGRISKADDWHDSKSSNPLRDAECGKKNNEGSSSLVLNNQCSDQRSLTKSTYAYMSAHVDDAERSGIKTFSADCYSFLAIYSPLKDPFFFFFGFLVFIFQVTFLLLFMISTFKSNGSHDNPVTEMFPTNVKPVVRITQYMAIVSYVIFADASLRDCGKAIEYLPRWNDKSDEDVTLVIFSCVLRFFQGFLATVVALILIITSDDVVEIILNFTAVNFISALDDCAFELARWGKFGLALQEEAMKIENRPIPYCLYMKQTVRCWKLTVIPVGIIMFSGLTFIITMQCNLHWTTKMLRVEFQTSTGLQLYSGCYERDPSVAYNQRYNYKSSSNNNKKGFFGYCKNDSNWILFEDDEPDSSRDPCLIQRDNKLARSGATDNFDVSSTFGEVWFSANGAPLNLYFLDVEDKKCGSFQNDGNCDEELNELGYQYDDGDCCASTCTHPNCGQGGSDSAFGFNGRQGNSFPHCKNPDMKPVTILLNKISSSRNSYYVRKNDSDLDEYYLERGIGFWEEPPLLPFFNVDCDGFNVLSVYIAKTMETKNETIRVPDGARCEISVRNTTDSNNEWDSNPIWWVDYTVYYGSDKTNKIISGYSGDQDLISFKRIPECYFKVLIDSIDISTAYTTHTDSTQSLAWLVNDASNNSKCDNGFLGDRFALGAMYFAAPIIPALEASLDSSENYRNKDNGGTMWISTEQQCRWKCVTCGREGSVSHLRVTSMNLDGTISTYIGLLTGLERIEYDINGLFGTIPSEIGQLMKLTGLDIDYNKLTGNIPSEIGNLVNMIELDLDENELIGTIPTQLGRMIHARQFDLKNNELTGTIPTEIGNCIGMKSLMFDDNNLSGNIPSEIVSLSSLQVLQLGTS
jgi:hypothetical protein